MTAITETCHQEGVFSLRGIPVPLMDSIKALERLELAGFLTRYDGNGETSEGCVVAVNNRFLAVVGDKSASHFLNRTYPDIHGPVTAASYTAAERAVMTDPGRCIRIDEGPNSGVQVVKVAIGSGAVSTSAEAISYTYIIGYFKLLGSSPDSANLDPQLVKANEALADLLPLKAG